MDTTNTAIVSMGMFILFGCIYLKKKRTRRIARRFWVNPYLQDRSIKGRFHTDVCITKMNKNNYSINSYD